MTAQLSTCSCLYWAVNLLPLGDALVLASFTPLLVAVLSPLLIGEVPSRCAPHSQSGLMTSPSARRMSSGHVHGTSTCHGLCNRRAMVMWLHACTTPMLYAARDCTAGWKPAAE